MRPCFARIAWLGLGLGLGLGTPPARLGTLPKSCILPWLGLGLGLGLGVGLDSARIAMGSYVSMASRAARRVALG